MQYCIYLLTYYFSWNEKGVLRRRQAYAITKERLQERISLKNSWCTTLNMVTEWANFEHVIMSEAVHSGALPVCLSSSTWWTL